MQEGITKSPKTENHHLRTAEMIAPEVTPQATLHLGDSFTESRRWSGFTGNLHSPFTILLAEDDDDLRYLMGQILEGMGYSVISCRDARYASEAFRSSIDIGLLLTDLQMPGNSGVELAREVTALLPSLPVMIVSASIRSTGLIREMRFRKWKFLAKPFAVPTFMETVHTLLPAGLQRIA